MSNINSEEDICFIDVENDIDSTRKFLKDRLQNDNLTFWGHIKEYNQIKDILIRTADYSESNSALLIGPRGCGKSTLISSVLYLLMVKKSFRKNIRVVYLNGFIHTDDKIALQSSTVQLQLEKDTDGKTFGSFAENLAFLLACLKSSAREVSKSVIFILDEFDLFCAHHNQTLIYNLFDVAQSAQAPICVLGLTCRLDVVELLEKRVKSRFSHRQIFLNPGDDVFVNQIKSIEELLILPQINEKSWNNAESVNSLKFLLKRCCFDLKRYADKFSDEWIQEWNSNIEELLKDSKVLMVFKSMFDHGFHIQNIKTLLFKLVCDLDSDKIHINVPDILALSSQYELDYKMLSFCDLSILEICVIIAIKHHSEIYDGDPFNFEMILTRLRKFENSSLSGLSNNNRTYVLKAFEHLHQLNFIEPISVLASKSQKEFQMHKLNLRDDQINKAVEAYPNLPTDISQWALSSLV